MRKQALLFATLAAACLTACSSKTSDVKISPSSSKPIRSAESISSSKGRATASSSAEKSSEVVEAATVVSTAPTAKETIQEVSGTQPNAERTETNPPMDEETLKRLKAEMDAHLAKQVIRTGNKVMLSVKPQLQEARLYCAPTTVSMMLSARGIVVNQHSLAQDMGTYEPFGTHNRDAIRVLNSYLFGYETPAANQAGYRLETVKSASAEEVRLFKERLRQNIADGYPMYYTFDCAKLYPGFKGEHNVIGIGYELTPDGQDIAHVYYLDPYPNVQDPTYGGLKKVTPETLLTAMLTCVEPNYGW